jgi:tetratricopeptide (TPR) repeat protein
MANMFIGLAAVRLGNWASTIPRHEAKRHLDTAVDLLRQSGERDRLAEALLARSEYHRTINDHEKARRELRIAFQLAEKCGMRLVLADCLLEEARICIAEGRKADARDALEKAQALAKQMEYLMQAKPIEQLLQKLVT